MERAYLCIDLKSFYASVECVERGLDPMSAKLVVADPDRTDKTICLAVSPALKALGVRNRCRVFEIPAGIDYVMAEPRMQKYIDYAANIYAIYLRYFSPDDIHVYSIDEAFIDVTSYLDRYHMNAHELAVFLMERITREIGVRSTAGIGSNLYLAKIALDITAKHAADYIGILTEESYRAELWDHRPLTDFWRIGHGIAEKLAACGIYTMRDIASADEDFLFRLFGIDAELLIDHAWGRESTTISDIKAYQPKVKSLNSGQVLSSDYPYDKAIIIVKEMTEAICLDLIDKKLCTQALGLYIRFAKSESKSGGRAMLTLPHKSNSPSELIPVALNLFEQIVPKDAKIRGVNLVCGGTVPANSDEQLSLLDNSEDDRADKSRRVEASMLSLKKRFGKNIVLRGTDFEDGATARERNIQIGGHKRGDS